MQRKGSKKLSCVRFTFGNYVIKPSKWEIKPKLRQNFVTKNLVRVAFGSYVIKPSKWDLKVTDKIRSKYTLELHYKIYFRITLGSCVGISLGNYVIKPCKWEGKTCNYYVMV